MCQVFKGFEDCRAASEWENDECATIEESYFTYPELLSLGYALFRDSQFPFSLS